ncbi:GMC family oxidoreductase [Corallococcus sp. M34]|uniref:GMC family oxidoreductase N-terminal domain-containing protein n=1 Tax=Citreicoccus inhibens TaxID=2849499 RepID=UPI001C2435B2|nr:GMC family oxidoreductase [Citreicoccus inhibens]MBU8897132.1 GMC family oxidoreductase [Citreicoccus inhibens]
MLAKLFDALLWLYWKANRRFLIAFSVALLGDEPGPFQPDGTAIVDALDKLLKTVSRTVYVQLIATVATIPLAVPPMPLPSGSIARGLVKLWYGIKSNFLRASFLAKSRKQRVEFVDAMFRRLVHEAPEQEDDMVKTIVTLTILKGVIGAAYLDSDAIWQALGYKPYQQHDFAPPSGPDLANPPLTAAGELLIRSRRTPQEVAKKPAGKRTYCIVGSGAGGSVAALSIQEHDPDARIILLEGGPLTTGNEFSTRLLDAVAVNYMNAAITLSEDQMFTFRQGRGVGGSTLVNNSLAFRPVGYWWDQNLVARWEALGVKLDWHALNKAYDDLEKLIHVAPVDDRVVTRASHVLRDGFEKIGLKDNIVRAPLNVVKCIGCGRCNLGCQYDAKQSMMVEILPTFVRNGGLLVPDAKVDSIEFEEKGQLRHRVKTVTVITEAGEKVKIEADRFILAPGAYASSKLLWRSGFTGVVPGVRTVGKRFSVNLGTAVIGVFPQELNAFAGQQAGFAIEVPEERMVIETGFAPPAAVGMMAPQWGNAFNRLISRSNNMVAAIPVLSSLTYGQIKKSLLGDSGFAIDFTLIDEDWRRLATGMKLSAQAMFAVGAEEVFNRRFDALSIRRPEDIDMYLAGMGAADFIPVESAHMQGGNVIAPKDTLGVVDEHLKVYGTDNLWICDASVIPSPITVNIALTVMALARYAAPFIVRDTQAQV